MRIYTDASFDAKRGIAGFGIVVDEGQKRRVYSNYIETDNNNYAELFAVYIGAVLTGGAKSTVYTDSQTALDYLQGRRGKEYEAKHKGDWTRAQYIRHKNMQVLAYKIRQISPQITFDKIKGHQNKYQTHALGNDLADLMAKNGRAKSYERIKNGRQGNSFER